MTTEGMSWRVGALNSEWETLASKEVPSGWRAGGVWSGGVLSGGDSAGGDSAGGYSAGSNLSEGCPSAGVLSGSDSAGGDSAEGCPSEGVPSVGGSSEGVLAFAQSSTLGDLLAAVSGDPDAVLGALIAICLRGDSLAGRVVVQAMLPKMILMARRDAEHDLGAYLAALWERVQTYPLARRPQRVAANLALDTLKAVKRQSTRAKASVVVTDWAAPAGLASAEEVAHRRRGGAARVLSRAAALGVIDDHAREVLSVVYLDGRSAAQAGRELGLSPEVVRARCSRAVRRLRSYAPELACVAG